MDTSLDKIFNPGSIAIVGASETPGKAAERRTRSLLKGGYPGKVFLINPKREELFGRKVYPSLEAIPEPVDLVMIVIPAPLIPDVITQSVRKKARGAIIITAGLGETGKEGKDIETRILNNAEKGNVRIIGPNCSGMFSRSARMNLLGVPPIEPGPVAIIAQSGNIIDSLTHYAKVRGIGFSKIISAGNAIGVKFHEYIEYLGEDPDTKVICMYMEGIKDGDKLVATARKVTRKKPIVALKVGRSGAGARAAASHTGSLAVDDKVVDAAFQQAGILRVTNADVMFDLAECFSKLPLSRGRCVAIMSEGGGDNSVAADNAEAHGLTVPVLSRKTQEKIRPFLLKGMPAQNPIDYGGTAEENPHMITECCKICMETDEVDAIYITGFFGGFKEIIAPHVEALEIQTARDLTELVKTYQKPILMHTSFANEPFESLRILKDNGIPVFASSERTAFCLGAMAKAAERIHAPEEVSHQKNAEPNETVTNMLRSLKSQGVQTLLETEVRSILQAYGIPVPEAILAKSADEAVRAAGGMGMPVAMKIVSRKIVHKSDVGGVRINMKTPEEISGAFREIMGNALKVAAKDEIEGILITPMARAGQECIIGMTRNPQFGPVVMFGLGGIFVEVLKDVTFRVAPLTPADAEEMIRRIKGYPLLQGVRGQAPKDTAALKKILLGISRLSVENPDIREMDLNPVIVHEKGASIVDARMIIG
jgi:acetyltransferase